MLGSQEEAERWLKRPAIGLNRQRPIDLLTTPAGGSPAITRQTSASGEAEARLRRKPCPPRPDPDASALLLAGKDERLAARLDHVELRIGAQLLP